MKSWTQIAFSKPVVSRALKYAIIVGTILISINHGDAILRGDIHAGRIFRMLLTTLVPYIVSTLSSVGAIRQMSQSSPPSSPPAPSTRNATGA